MVHFVGAGSGAPDLITVRGARLLQEADVIIYAGSLVNPAVLQYARKDCALYNSAEMTLEQVSALRNVLSRYALIVCAWNPPRNSWILFPEETRARIEKTLGEYFGDMDSGKEIDFEKVVPFNEFLGPLRTEKTFHVRQESIDPAAYARKLENEMINGRPAQNRPQDQNQ